MVEGHIKMKKKVQGKKPAAKPCRSTPKKKPAYISQKEARKNPGIHPAIGSDPAETDFSSDEDFQMPKMPALQKKMKPPTAPFRSRTCRRPRGKRGRWFQCTRVSVWKDDSQLKHYEVSEFG